MRQAPTIGDQSELGTGTDTKQGSTATAFTKLEEIRNEIISRFWLISDRGPALAPLPSKIRYDNNPVYISELRSSFYLPRRRMGRSLGFFAISGTL